jgi:predicted Zn-dependent protease
LLLQYRLRLLTWLILLLPGLLLPSFPPLLNPIPQTLSQRELWGAQRDPSRD